MHEKCAYAAAPQHPGRLDRDTLVTRGCDVLSAPDLSIFAYTRIFSGVLTHVTSAIWFSSERKKLREIQDFSPS